MENQAFLNKITCGEALQLLGKTAENSIDIVLTDPPYFLDKMDNVWSDEKVSNTDNQYAIKSLPAGMKFERRQGQKFYAWYLDISKAVFRVLKPGGFFFSFSSPRLYHRLACAVEDAGFEIRDLFMWLYTRNQPKAMGLDHFIDKSGADKKTKEALKKRFRGWKTPQIKSCFEPIAMAQKPTDKTYLNNMSKLNVGLLNANIKIGDNMYPANVFSIDHINEIIDKVFLLPKPSKDEKGRFNDHKTVKPLAICRYLIALSAFAQDAVILDPFAGSATTAIAAKSLGKNFIAFDINKKYVDIAKRRLKGM